MSIVTIPEPTEQSNEAQDDQTNPPPSPPDPVSDDETLSLSQHFDSQEEKEVEEEEEEEGASSFLDDNNPTPPLPLSCDILNLLGTDEAFQQLSLSDNCYLRSPLFAPKFSPWEVPQEKPTLWEWDPQAIRLGVLNREEKDFDQTVVFSSSARVGAGLSNLGNTCFMNAILQCFTHTVPLVEGLRACAHSFPCDRYKVDEFCVICALRDHVELSLAASGGRFSPLRLVNNLSYFSSTFRRYQQEDAHEFLQCALDKLDRCFRDLKSKEENGDKGFEGVNLVESVFGGRLVSKIVCSSCGHSSNTYELLIDMSLEIENADTLRSALESFTKVEHIEANFKCDGCKEEVSLEKQLLLDRTPSVAAFHLKRFKTDGTSVEKIDKHVDFPLELDLQPYSISDQNGNVAAKYDLYAVVVHIGLSANSGHYFCYVRSAPDIWHKLDDSDVTMVSEDSVLSQKASILFYAQEGTPWFSSIMESSMPLWDQITSNTSPKSVLDKFNSSDNSKPIITETIVRRRASKEKIDLPWMNVNDTGDASHGCKQFPSKPNLDSVGLNVSALVDGNSHVESGGCPRINNCYEALFDFGMMNDGFNRLTPPGSRSSLARAKHLKED
ncbi:hypothetical protein RIF29_38642 [Crotalaria pallida]|uniref:Ubiquitin carboxyl-terminal hydrolase n=1 Tax=Crotalaria pallida TaxID=3830 RepID=A0AAN9E0C7_CROPI